jgi:hypothetical protein
MNKNEMHRVPGFTAEKALEKDSTSYAGLARSGSEGGAVEPAYLRHGGPGCITHCTRFGECTTECYWQ